jgi:hypothetical protein
MPSTVIRSFRYDADRQELNIVFQSGRSYAYAGVPERTYAALKAALSKGEFFNRRIRGKFPFTRNGQPLAFSYPARIPRTRLKDRKLAS